MFNRLVGNRFLLTIFVISTILVQTILIPSVRASSLDLEVRVVGTFDGRSSSDYTSGTISSTSESLSDIYTFEASCLDITTCGAAPTADWYFGDGTTFEDAALKITHRYSTPGKFRVRVVVKSNSGTGSATHIALASQKFADVHLDIDSAEVARSDRFNLWAASALGFIKSCGPALPANILNLSPTSYKVNRALLCPEPTLSPLMTSTPDMPASAQFNGITNENCLDNYYNCGLPERYFTTTNPDLPCDESCQENLENNNFIDPQGKLIYDPLNCSDGWVAKRAGIINPIWTVVAGVELGCMTRGDFFISVASSITELKEDSSFSCQDAAQSESLVAASKLFSIGIDIRRVYPTGSFCDFNDSITKSEAYLAVPLFDTTNICDTPLRDLNNRTLGYGLTLTYPSCGKLTKILSTSLPVVGETRCTDRLGRCFNPNSRLTRSESAELLAALAAFRQNQNTGFKVGIASSSNPVPIGESSRVVVNVEVPVSFRVTDQITASWSDPSSGISLRSCAKQSTQSIGNDFALTFSCSYTRQAAGSSSIEITLTTASTRVSKYVYTLITEDEAPRVGAISLFENNEGESSQFTIPISNPSNTPLVASLRSFDDYDFDPGVYPTTGNRAGTGWANSISTLSGTITIASISQTGLTLNLTSDPDAYGPWRAVGRVCGTTLCTIFFLEGETIPLNDQPLPGNLQSFTGTYAANILIKVSGSDPQDIERFDYPSLLAIELYRIDSLPEDGLLLIDSNPGLSETWVPATVGVTTNNPSLKYTFPESGDPESEGYIPPPSLRNFSYSVKDIGYPLPAKWSDSQQVALLL